MRNLLESILHPLSSPVAHDSRNGNSLHRNLTLLIDEQMDCLWLTEGEGKRTASTLPFRGSNAPKLRLAVLRARGEQECETPRKSYFSGCMFSAEILEARLPSVEKSRI